MNDSGTIVAISSAVGMAARMIVRMSGARAHDIAREIGAPSDMIGGGAARSVLFGGAGAWVYWFAGPRSYTGENLVEFHIPGSAVLARRLLDEMVAHGARQAEPGEFTARAYFNGRMDLTQAEGVAATISAHSQQELRAARQLLGGELGRRLTPIMEQIAGALALIEVGIDFSDEDVTFISAGEVQERCGAASAALEKILNESARFERLSHEPRIVLAGRPNAGKSTLLNALAGSERAVVSNVAGTTRDAISAQVRLARGTVRVVDVAGVEGSGLRVQGSGKEIEDQMLGQALRAVGEGDFLVLVEDAADGRERSQLGREPDLVVRTKVDLMEPAGQRLGNCVSAISGAGMEELRERLDALAFGGNGAGAGLAINARHVRAIQSAREALARAGEAIEAGAELAALDLREALDALGQVLGKISPDDLLGLVFSRFCIGK